MESTRHWGVYGVWKHDGKLVLVRKARGPYTGLLDLPGGTPEDGESVHETLRREVHEETGVELVGVRSALRFNIHVRADSSGAPIDFHHEGWIADVHVAGALRCRITDQDVAGVVLVESRVNEDFSPLVLEALRLFPELAVP